MEKLEMHTPDLVNRNKEQLAKLFPHIMTETWDKNGNIKKAIDFDLLKQALSEDLVEDEDERYRLDWPGKKASLLKANMPINKTLRPVVEESVHFENAENLFIEGDNFEVLKILQESYLGKVKMIYIDPPYNTGNDFIYKDDFKKGNGDYEEEIGARDENGSKLFRNTDSNGRFHSDWLSMMYERLVIARDLLKEDGVIFISIDDNEVANLRKICDEVFGEDNFFSQIIIRANSRGQTYKQIAKTHEHVLIYTISEETQLSELEKDEINNDLNYNDEIGNFNIRELRNRNPKFGKHNRPNLFFPIFINSNIKDKDGFSPLSLTESEKYTIKVEPINSMGKESCWRWGKK